MKSNLIGITGVCGFIGSNLAKNLLKNGYKVIGVDNMTSGRLENINEIIKHKNFNIVKVDTSNLKTLKKAFKSTNVIFHLSSSKIPRYGNRAKTLEENVNGMKNVLEVAVLNKSKVIFTSTSDVYGKNPKLPFSEDSDLLLGPTEVARWAYATSKIFDEQLCFAYSEIYDLNIFIARLFGVYGPFQSDTWTGGPHLVFANSLLKGKSIEIHGSGLQTRSFVYIDDVVDALILMLESKVAGCNVFNVGTSEEISVINLAKIISTKLNKKLKYKKIPYSKFTGKKYEDVKNRKPNIKKAYKVLGWKPKTTLEMGLSKTLKWYVSK